MTDYVFKYTNNPGASFVVKPYTANGPMSPSVTTPYVNATTGIHAISTNTPFVLVGKGVTDYGQLVQNNILYLAENFCNTTRPIPPMKGMMWFKNADYVDPAYPGDPTVAGMYVWDGTAWSNVLINGKIASLVNVNGNRIVNVGDAQVDTDALNANSANARYLRLSGGTLTGNLVFSTTSTAKVTAVPTANEDVTNKLYVDSADVNLQNSIDGVQTDLDTNVTNINQQISTLYAKSGGTISGDVAIAGNLTIAATGNVSFGNGSGTVDVGQRVVANVGAPTLAFDAANKAYVDNSITLAISKISIPPASTADGVVSSGFFNDATGVLTLSRTQGLAPITVAGLFAAKDHAHDAATILYDPTINNNRSIFGELSINVATTSDAIRVLDSGLRAVMTNPIRTVVTQTVPGNTTFSLGDRYAFQVWGDRLMVFMNGIKQYGDLRAETSVAFPGAGVNVPVGIAGTFTQGITVDGTPYSFTTTVASTDTYMQLYNAIVAAITTAAVPVRCMIDQLSGGVMFTFVSNASGAGHAVLLDTTAGQLIPSIPSALPQVQEAGMTLSYSETGAAGDETFEIVFHTAPPVGAVIEVTILGIGISD